MECYSYASSHPDSSDSSPPSRDFLLDGDANPSYAAAPACPRDNNEPPPPPARIPAADSNSRRVKLMISYGGLIQPRLHDNQLSYIGGETKILAVDRAVRFFAILLRLAALAGAASTNDLCFKYQLPGEDLDALISVTDDEDLDHMMLEYDRLQQFHANNNNINNCGSSRTSSRLSGAKPSSRLRLFLFPLGLPPPPPSAALLDHAAKADRQWFVDALNSIQTTPEAVAPIESTANASPSGPDFLFGVDNGFVSFPAVKVKEPSTPDPSAVVIHENFSALVEKPELTAKENRQHQQQNAANAAVVHPVEIQRQIQELDRLQIPEKHQHQPPPPAMQRNGIEESLTRVYPQEYHLPRIQKKAPQQPLPTYWPAQRSVAAAPPMYASVAAGGDQTVYLIPAASAGVYPGAAMPAQAYYAAVTRVVPADTYRDAAFYAVPPAPPSAAAPAQLAYDSAGSAVYLAGGAATGAHVPGGHERGPERGRGR